MRIQISNTFKNKGLKLPQLLYLMWSNSEFKHVYWQNHVSIKYSTQKWVFNKLPAFLSDVDFNCLYACLRKEYIIQACNCLNIIVSTIVHTIQNANFDNEYGKKAEELLLLLFIPEHQQTYQPQKISDTPVLWLMSCHSNHVALFMFLVLQQCR